MLDITTHTLVKNGDPYIKYALKAVRPFVKRMIIIDTGSTDKTVEIIKELIEENYPITFMQHGPFKGSWDVGIPELTRLRNKMLDMTETEWTLQVDDDEIYPKEVFEEIESVLKNPASIISMALPFYNFINDHNTITEEVVPTSRVFRTDKIEFFNDWPGEMLRVKGEKEWLNKFKDKRVITLKNKWYHYGLCRKKKDTVQRPEENLRTYPFIKDQPEVFPNGEL